MARTEHACSSQAAQRASPAPRTRARTGARRSVSCSATLSSSAFAGSEHAQLGQQQAASITTIVLEQRRVSVAQQSTQRLRRQLCAHRSQRDARGTLDVHSCAPATPEQRPPWRRWAVRLLDGQHGACACSLCSSEMGEMRQASNEASGMAASGRRPHHVRRRVNLHLRLGQRLRARR